MSVPPHSQPRGIPSLLAEALRGAGDVVRGEVALLRQEMAANLQSLIVGVAAMAGAALFAVVGFLILVDSLVKWLASFVCSEALAALIIGVLFLAFGVVLAFIAKSRFSLDGLVPTQTGRQLRQDTAVIKEHMDA